MTAPSETEWHFAEVRKADGAIRADRLASAPDFGTIVEHVRDAVAQALVRKRFRCGVNSFNGHDRVLFQFEVSPELYDFFFNSRTGYRAQFWISPQQGKAANRACLDAALPVLFAYLPETFMARQIKSNGDDHRDIGPREVSRSFSQESFGHEAAKLWICENLISGRPGQLMHLPIGEGPLLNVPCWRFASAPCPKQTWPEFKGGCVGGKQPKDPCFRARHIHETGFS